MFYKLEICSYGKTDILLYKDNEEYFREWQKNLELMQYTGLTDRNGIEIYEGDIVRVGNVETRDGISDMNVPVEYVRGIFEPIAYINDDALEVIGNIYENSELLAPPTN